MSNFQVSLRSTRRKGSFISQLKHGAVLLDVGCGNESPQNTKTQRPDLYYVGIDVGDYVQTDVSKSYADEYHIVSPTSFDDGIIACGLGRFDAVISAHNIEHCLNPDQTVEAMCKVLKPGGEMHLTFPCEASVNFPSRENTLNFYDDPTHVKVPNWAHILKLLADHGMRIDYKSQRYRPLVSAVIGALYEPFVAPLGKKGPKASTWSLYGFESLIWASKI